MWGERAWRKKRKLARRPRFPLSLTHPSPTLPTSSPLDAADTVAALTSLGSPPPASSICAAAAAASPPLDAASAAGVARLLAAGACPTDTSAATAAAAAIGAALQSGTVAGVHAGVVGGAALIAVKAAAAPTPAALATALDTLTPLKRTGGAYADAEDAPPSALAGARVAEAAAAARGARASVPAGLDTAARRLLPGATPTTGGALPGDTDALAVATSLIPVAVAAGDAAAGSSLASFVVAAKAAATSSPRRAAAILAALDAASNLIPTSLRVDPASVAVDAGGRVRVEVTSALGGGPALGVSSVSAALTSAVDGAVIAPSVTLHAEPGSDDYTFDLSRAVRGVAGSYDAVVTATGSGGAVLGVTTARVALVQVISFTSGSAGITGGAIGVDVEDVAVGKTLPGLPLALSEGGRFKATVTAASDGSPADLAAFGALLTHTGNGATAYVAGGPGAVRAGASKPPRGEYTVSFSAADAAAAGATAGGDYTVRLVGGGATGQGVEWRVASVSLLTSDAPAPPSLGPLPTIDHQFRPPAKRAPVVIALVFSALTAAPLALLAVALRATGANFKGFPAPGTPERTATLAFHAGLGAVLALYGVFWARLNLLQLATPLAVVGGATAIAGHKALAAHAAARAVKGARKVE